jgi:acetate kinase
MSKVMSINAGSSSLKFQLFEMPEEKVLVSGLIERIGFEDAYFTIKVNGEKIKKVLPIKDHKQGVAILLESLIENKIIKSLDEINGVGHRMVQGGDLFKESVVVKEDTIALVSQFNDLAPLHNPAAIVGYEAFKNALPNAGHVLVFDTAFHSHMPKLSYMYATPYEWYEKYGVRKYGAHGTSHAFVSDEAIKYLGLGENSKVITCHIGNGASISAVLNGTKCVKKVNGGISHYTCPVGYALSGTKCSKTTSVTVDANVNTKTNTSYKYKWSKSASLDGWEFTGKTKVVKESYKAGQKSYLYIIRRVYTLLFLCVFRLFERFFVVLVIVVEK